MEIRPVKQEEWKYTYAQSMQLKEQTGSIGHLRGDFGRNGDEFFTTWNDHHKEWKTDSFRKELDEVINSLRMEECGLLAGRKEMRDYVRQFSDCMFQGNRGPEYGFRADTKEHAFLLRCNPSKGDYNVYCFCSISRWLDRHIERARKGIRFIDPHYKEKFWIPDGGEILVTTAWGEKRKYACRYIDGAHFETSSESGRRLYHICQFAENMERNGSSCEPVETGVQEKGNKSRERQERVWHR